MKRQNPLQYTMRLTHNLPPSAISNYFALCYSVVILIISLSPFSGWRITGIPIFDFYTYPLPYYYTFFDNAINVCAYIPLGFAIALNRGPRFAGIVFASLSGLLLSASIEFIQQFLPTRIASNLDILSNSTGAFLGALCAILIPWRQLQQFLRIRHMWLRSGHLIDIGTVWLALWTLTQLNPAEPLFSLTNTAYSLPQPLDAFITHPTLFLVLWEIGRIFLQIVGVGLFASCLVRSRSAISAIIWLTFGLGFLCKMIMAISLLKVTAFFSWLNFNLLIGGCAATWALIQLLRLSSRLRAIFGCIALILWGVLGWFWSMTSSFNPMFNLFNWQQGHLLHFMALAHVIAEIWSYGAIIILLGIALRHRLNRLSRSILI